MANLLQKASIVLTPTAYDDGKVLCAKPSEPPYGDFDFSRNSAATRVNAQGLVENVQILSSNLVQNGDFSEEGAEEVSNGSFSQEGSELITNGNFDTDSDWTKQASWSISGGAANYDFLSDAKYIRQTLLNGGFVAGKTYKINFEITSGTAYMNINSNGGGLISLNSYSVGSYSLYTTASVNGSDLLFYGRNTSGTAFSIDNVSVREVGQDWTLGTGWSIGDNKASSDGSQTSNSSLFQPNVLTQNKYYKFEFTLSNVTSGAVRLRNGIGDSETYISYQNSNGTYTAYSIVNSSNKTLVVDADSSFNGSITNISVKEVGQNWDLGTGWSIGEDKAVAVSGSATKLQQTISGLSGKKCSVTFTLSDYQGTDLVLLDFGSTSGQSITANGTYTEIGTYDQNYFQLYKGANFSGNITNISVIEITTDTSLPRINYEGFSYQDALGSELVTNGSFDTDSSWAKGTGWSISGALNAAATTSTAFQINTGIVSGKTYNVTYTISNYVSGSVRIELGSGNVSVGTIRSANGTYTEYIVALGDETIYFDGIVSFTGSIDNVSVKEYLGQEVVPDSGCGSWLFEPQSTNLITYSEDLSTYSTTNVTVSATTEKSPINSVAPFLITETPASNQHFIGGNFISLNGNNTIFCFVKNVSLGRYFKIWGFGLGALNEAVIFDTNTETIYEPPTSNVYVGGSAKLEDYGNGWFRCSITINTTTTNSLAIGLINTVTGFGNNTYLGDITKSVLITGIQVEQQSYATSYIPTSGTSVTRNQDLCTNGGSLASINSTEGVLYAEIAALANGGLSRYIALSNGSNNERVQIIYSSTANYIVMNVVSSNSVQAQFTVTVPQTQYNKLAISYKANDVSFWLNGIKVHTDTNATMPIGLNVLEFQRPNNTSSFFGKTKALAVWKEALSDQELADLTYPTPTDPTFALDFDTIATDFTFARGSEATYVDAQGLIQSTNELGPEEITNGDFSTDGIPSTTSWSLGWYSQTSNVLISGGKLTLTNSASQSTALAYATDGVSSLNVVTVNKTYKLQYRVIENNGVTSFKYYSAGGSFIVAPTDLGVTHTIYIKNTANQIFLFQNATTNSSISIDNVSIKEYKTETNTPRIDYSTGTEAFLLEPQSTNLVPYSEDFEVWNQIQNVNLISNSTISPSGENNATKFLSTTGNSKVRNNFSVVSGTTYTFSVYCKNIDATFVRLLAYDGANEFSLNVVSQINTSTWTKVSLTFTATNTSGSGQVQIARDLPDGESLYFWGAQLEQQSYATSYIPTSGTTVTRNQETCINATPEINSEEGVLYAEIAKRQEDNDNFILISLNNAASNSDANSVTIGFSNDTDFYSRVRANAVNVMTDTTVATNANQFYKVALKYKSGNISVFIDGVNVVSNTTAFSFGAVLDNLSFDYNGNGTLPFFGNTKDLQVYTKALSDAELIKLTT